MRYIGNKNKLLSEIDSLLERKKLKCKGLVFCDLFAGTGTVANNYNGYYNLIANDFLDFAYYYTAGQLHSDKATFDKLGVNPFEYFNEFDTTNYKKGFCYNNFSPHGKCQYFSDENAKKIDFIRDKIDEWYSSKKISYEEKCYLIACLLESVSKVSNVAGVYSAYLKIWDPRALNELVLKPLEIKKTKYKNECHKACAEELIENISGDILYVDPPYTPTQYNSQYHVLETIARNDNPVVHGVGKHRKNDRLSNWCKKGFAEYEFEKLIKNAKFKHIIFSYSDKGLMSLKFLESALKRYAKDDTYELKKINFVKYKSSRAVAREKIDNTENEIHYEYLFYIAKSNAPKYISPLNYIGGKFDTIDLIKDNLPDKIDTFYDLFGGGATVSLNVNAKNIVYNEINTYVVDLLNYLANTKPYDVYTKIQKEIKKYGLEKANKDAYVKLRDEYNNKKESLLLYLLICYGFEHQIRFNSKHEFNNPCGNSGFNDEMYEKIISFYLRCNEIKITFKNDYYNKCITKIKSNDFVYLDPPYLGNDGVYQDGKRGFDGWDKEKEENLRVFIKELDLSGNKFMLSNYTEHSNGNTNYLLDWVNSNKFNYKESDKLTKRNRHNRREIIVTNY